MSYSTLLTKVGQALLATAHATGTPVKLTHLAVGDGDGAQITPREDMSALRREVWRGALNTLSEDPQNPGWIMAEAVVPETSGGFTIREVGLFDETGKLVAVGSLPDSYKPQLAEGSAKTFYIRMRIEIGNASSVTLLIDPSVVLATKAFVSIEIGKVRADVAALAVEVEEHLGDHANPHQVTAGQVGAETVGAVAAHDESPTAHEDIRLLAARPIIDHIARDQIALANLRMLINTAVTTGALVQGRMWELLTSEWATGSTDCVLVAGPPNYYTNLLQSVVGNPLANGGRMGTGQTCRMDLNFALPAGSLVSVQLFFDAPQAGCKVSVWRQVSGNQYAFVGQSQVFAAVAGLNTVVLTTPIAVQAGDRLALYNPTQDVAIYSGGGSSLWVNADATATTTFSAGGNFMAIQGTVIGGISNMTLLQPAPIVLASAPSWADAYCLYKDDSGSAVLGTDLVVEMSRDNGGTWTPASSYVNETGTGGFDGTYAAIKARCNLSAQPSGTSLRSRIKTLNTKAQRVAAPAVYAE